MDSHVTTKPEIGAPALGVVAPEITVLVTVIEVLEGLGVLAGEPREVASDILASLDSRGYKIIAK
jgi:hypothetical protein